MTDRQKTGDPPPERWLAFYGVLLAVFAWIVTESETWKSLTLASAVSWLVTLLIHFVRWWPWSAWETIVVILLVFIWLTIRGARLLIHYCASQMKSMSDGLTSLEEQIKALRREVRDLNK